MTHSDTEARVREALTKLRASVSRPNLAHAEVEGVSLSMYWPERGENDFLLRIMLPNGKSKTAAVATTTKGQSMWMRSNSHALTAAEVEKLTGIILRNLALVNAAAGKVTP